MVLVIEMKNWLFAIVCTPFCTFANVVNVFFIFCTCKPAEGVSINQPLRFLLAVMLRNSSIHQFMVLISIPLSFFTPPDWLLVINAAIVLQTFCTSFSTSAWISIFYYMKIVPQHNKILIWIKKNIKVILYGGIVFDQVFLLSAIIMGTAAYLPPPFYANKSAISQLNYTAAVSGAHVLNSMLFHLATRVFLGYLTLPVITMIYSWGRTFYFLHGHMKNMKQTTSFSSKLQKNQMRVTKMGILQTALFIPNSMWAIGMALIISSNYNIIDDDKHITMTISSICGLGNLLCLGSSQSIFRFKVIFLLKRFKKTLNLKLDK